MVEQETFNSPDGLLNARVFAPTRVAPSTAYDAPPLAVMYRRKNENVGPLGIEGLGGEDEGGGGEDGGGEGVGKARA